MKFSERALLKMPKRAISRHQYDVDARSRYNRYRGWERIERINPQQLARVPDILKEIGFVVVRNIVTESTTGLIRSRSLRNKQVVAALRQAWGRFDTDNEQPPISVLSNGPSEGMRFNQPGFHVVMPANGKELVCITQPWRAAQATLYPGDALAWNQGEGYFPSVELHNPTPHYIGSYVLHESVAYSNPSLAPEVPSVSQ